MPQNIKKGFYYLTLGSNNQCKRTHFKIGYLYHDYKYKNRDINKAIKYYKEGSSFNDHYSKNNLGIIYKNGIIDEIPQNIDFAIIYFSEAIKQKKDKIAMYNLAHIYLYFDNMKEKINYAIDLLIESAKCDFLPAKVLLCLALIKKYGFNIKIIQENIFHLDSNKTFLSSIIQMICKYQLFDSLIFIENYEYYRTIDYLYDFNENIIPSNNIINNQANDSNKNITSDFYDGFGI